LQIANRRLGILSNTCTAHWRYCIDGRYPILNSAFDVYALSYELGAVKPAAKIFAGAAQLAGVAPEKIFFVDDIAGHVAGARAAGYEAVQYTSAPALAAELRQRGLDFNY
jgi:FMN phosphatase YigB (HAD superfamily)